MRIAPICSRLLFSVAMTASAWSCAAEALKLGPRDRLRIKAYDWRPATGEMHEWSGLIGEFTVGASGALSLPIAGEIPVDGLSPEQLAELIATRVQDKVGLTRKPEVSVEVVDYRPFYILGRVNKPGEYPTRSGLTALEAVSLAGGFLRPAEVSAYELERRIETANGEVRALTAERVALLGRRARLEAELSGAATIETPSSLSALANHPQVARTLKEENQLLTTRRDALQAQIDGMTQIEGLLAREIDAQGDKRRTVERQLGLAKRELDSISGLVAKGLVVNSRELALEQSVAQFESSRTEIDLLTLRAQQDLARTGREKIALRDRQRAENLVELTQVSSQIAANAEKIQTAQELAIGYEQSAPKEIKDAELDLQRRLQFTLIHDENGRKTARTVDENAIVEPGDTLRIEARAASAADDEPVR